MPKGGKRPGAGRPAGSKSKIDPDRKALIVATAMAAAPAALARIIELSRSPDTRVAMQASQYLVDRAIGKPAQAMAVTGEDGGPISIKVRWKE